MPVIDIGELYWPHGMFRAQITVRSVMAWPKDAEARRRYLATAMAYHLGEVGATLDELPDPAQAGDWFERVVEARENLELAQDLLVDWFHEDGGFAVVAAAAGVDTYSKRMCSRAGDWFAAGLILALVRRMTLHHRRGAAGCPGCTADLS